MDLRELIPGGDSNALVVQNTIQEVDTNKNVVFEWRGQDYFNIQDAIHENLTSSQIDYIHMNSIAVDFDNHLLISSRHLSECTKINWETGEIIWRLGGVNNQFTFLNDSIPISYQHDIRPVPGKPNHYTIFDNGNKRIPRFSRAVEYVIDTTYMTATKIWEYRHKPDRYTHWMGNAQRLQNENTLICWSDRTLPKATEVTPDGEVVYEGNFKIFAHCYRSFRFEWDGFMKEPYLIVENYTDRTRLIFNKFGDDSVSYYNIYGKYDSNPYELLASTEDTWIDLTRLQDSVRYYFYVTAVNTSGEESPHSKPGSAFILYTYDKNLIINGDFSFGHDFWDFITSEDAEAISALGDGWFTFEILNGGSDYNDIQLIQSDIPLMEGKEYIFKFDAYADESRIIEVRIEKEDSPWTNYGKIGLLYLTTKEQHYEFIFRMEAPNDFQARIVFNTGGNDANVHIGNLYLNETFTDTISNNDTTNNDTLTYIDAISNVFNLVSFPNPADEQVNLKYHQPFNGSLSIEIYDLTGKRIQYNNYGIKPTGDHTVILQLNGYKKGVYIGKLNLKSQDNRNVITRHFRVILQ